MILDVIGPVDLDGLEVSSSRIRADLHRGDVGHGGTSSDATTDFAASSPAVHGAGRTIGFPTANLERVETIVPGDGVYAVRATLPDGSTRARGRQHRPQPDVRRADAQGRGPLARLRRRPLRPECLTVDFVERLRDTRPFAGVPDLVAQLTRDVAEVRALVPPTPGETP